MKVGKISESVLKRSVLKMIKSKHKNVENGAGVGSDCAIFASESACLSQAVQTLVLQEAADVRYVIIKAVNSIAVSGADPVSIQLSLLLPAETDESLLQDIMREADRTAGTLHIQITGGHTEVTDAVARPCVSVTAAGILQGMPVKYGGARPGQDIVVSKWIGLEGTSVLAERYGKKLAGRYPLHMIEEAAGFDRYLSVVPEAATAVKSNVSAMHDVSGGGIFAALWELAESAGVGLAADLKKIPVRQETVEVCEFFGISPYELLSGGCLLMTADSADHLVQALETVHIPAAVIGKITDGNDRVVINEDEKRFLERPKSDEIKKILRRQ